VNVYLCQKLIIFIVSAETWRLSIDPFSSSLNDSFFSSHSVANALPARDTEMLEYSCNGEVRNAESNMSLVGGHQATLQTPMAPMAPDKDLRQQDSSDHDSSDMIPSSMAYSVVDEVIPCYCS
jgi:hypothetical protein